MTERETVTVEKLSDFELDGLHYAVVALLLGEAAARTMYPEHGSESAADACLKAMAAYRPKG